MRNKKKKRNGRNENKDEIIKNWDIKRKKFEWEGGRTDRNK